MSDDEAYGVRRYVRSYGEHPYVPPSPPNNGLGMGAGDQPGSANHSRMAQLGRWHLNQTQSVQWLGSVVSPISPTHLKVVLGVIVIVVGALTKELFF